MEEGLQGIVDIYNLETKQNPFTVEKIEENEENEKAKEKLIIRDEL